MMKSTILSTAERIDTLLPASLGRQTNKLRRLVILLVHSLYHHENEADNAGVYPHEQMTVDKLRQFFDNFLEMGYTFVSPDEVLAVSHLPDKAVMLTFDDGYHNFVRVLPLLHEYQIPATCFICPGYIEAPKSFWWDAFYRNARASGAGDASVSRQMGLLRKKSFDQIYRFITDRWGKQAFDITSDLDRPLTLQELQYLAREPLVFLGNHTFHHTALPFQDEATIRKEICSAEAFFEQELQQKPRVISYPNGDYADFVTTLCADLGYELGMTIDARWNTDLEHASSSQLLSLGRFMLSGRRDVKRQAKSINLPSSISSTIRRLKKHKYSV